MEIKRIIIVLNILKKRIAVFFLVCLTLQPLIAVSNERDNCLIAHSNTTFLQIWNNDLHRTQDDWNELFSKLKGMSFNKVILQWTLFRDNKKSEYLYLEHIISELLENLFNAANTHSIQLGVGLIYDDEFWQNISGSQSQVEDYFTKRLYQLDDHIRYLATLIESIDKNNIVFFGWYISDEIDNLSWALAQRRKILISYLKSVCDILKSIHPNWPVMVTGYTTPPAPEPQQHALFWKNLLTQSGVDKVLYQDSIGTGKVSLAYWRVLLNEFKKTMSADEFAVVIELFDMKEDSQGNHFYTASDFSRIKEQISIAQTMSTDDLVFFTAFDYLLDETVANSQRLHEQWRSSITTCKPKEP